MRPAVLLCSVLLLGAVCRADDDEECDCEKLYGGFRGDILRNRADRNDVEINRLFNAAWKLEEQMDKFDHQGPKVDELKARIDALTGNDCAGHGGQFECDDRSGCINPFLVCDNHDDCADHSDESEHTCTNLVPQGSSWGAAISHNECFKNPAHHLRIVIARAEHSDVFPSSVQLEATTFLYKKDGDISIGHAEGFYYFGKRSAHLRAGHVVITRSPQFHQTDCPAAKLAIKGKKPEGGGIDNCAAETDPIATAARGLVKGRKGRKSKSKHKEKDRNEPEEPARKGILIVPPRPPPPQQPIRVEQLEEVGRKGITVQPPPPPRPKGRDIEEQSDKGASLDSRTAPSLNDGGEAGGGDNTQQQFLTSAMRLNFLLGFGIILGLIGATLIVALGVLYVKPYINVRDMKLTRCTVAAAVFDKDPVTCACASDGCLSHYPCVKLWVNFTTDAGEEVVNSTLYDSYDTFILQHNALKCSFHKCSRAAATNVEAVQAWTIEYGNPGSQFPCYYAPHTPDHAILEVISVTLVVHCMLWPGLGLIIGVIILFLHVCDSSAAGSPRSSPFNSLERPWLRYADRNYEKVGTLAERDEHS